MPRFFTHQLLAPGCTIELEPSAARHVQVLRLQPGDAITLFNEVGNALGNGLGSALGSALGSGLEDQAGVDGEYAARILAMGRTTVSVVVTDFVRTSTGPARVVHLAVGMPANDRMDWLVEKATELGVTSITPLTTERSVLRLQGERLDKKLAHWRGVAIAASEQCGRSWVPLIGVPVSLAAYLKTCLGNTLEADHARLVLSLRCGALPLRDVASSYTAFTLLSGPEGGLSAAEEVVAQGAGFSALTLGPRTLRAETAPLAALAALQLR